MKTIKNNTTNEIIIKNSRFITLLMKITDDTNISLIIDEAKNAFPKANHYCYAYVTENYKKSSDDGEPGGTAGVPMLNVLEKEEIINVLAITIRYFGGIKLGAGGLVRAYSKSVRDSIISSEMIEVVKGICVDVKVSYDEQKNMDYMLKDYKIINKEFLEDITYKILIPKDKIDILNNYSYQIIKEEYIEKVH